MSIRETLSHQVLAPARGRAGRKAVAEAAQRLAPEIDRRVGGATRSVATELARMDAPYRAKVPDLLVEKYRRMSLSPFAFFRGTDALFYQDLARTEGKSAASGVATVLHGDLHLANYGTQLADQGKVIFGVNDFDEALAGPVMLDLKRFATSLAVLGEQQGLAPAASGELVRTFAKGYHEALEELAKHPKHPGKALPDRPELVEQLLDKAKKREMGPWLDKLAPEKGGVRRLARSETVLDPSPTAEKQVRTAFESYRKGLTGEVASDLAPYRVTDVTAAMAGTGSIGRARFRLLLEAPGQQARIMEIKEQAPSALEAVLGPNHPFKTEARRNLVVSEAFNGKLESFRGEVKAPGLGTVSDSFLVSRRFPAKDEFAVEELASGQLDELVGYYGALVARGHAAGTQVGLAGARELLAELPKGKTLGKELAAFAETYAPQVRRDHAAFKAALAQDPLLAKFAP